MKKLLWLTVLIGWAGIVSGQVETDYRGMTKQQIFEALNKNGAVHIGYNVCRNQAFSNAGCRFESWQELVKDPLYYNMRQWRINMQVKRIAGKEGVRETVLTFKDGKVVRQEVEEWTYPPTREYAAKVERFTSKQGRLRQLLESEPMPPEPVKYDIEKIKKESAAGNDTATIQLALCYADGIQLPQDLAMAEKLLKSVAGKGHVDAQYILGSLYEQGPSEIQNFQSAAIWYAKAAEKGHAAAQCNLGSMYFFGKGIAVDYKKARELFEKAAAQGDDIAMINIAMMYYYGRGVPRDLDETVKFLKKASEKGNADAEKILKRLQRTR